MKCAVIGDSMAQIISKCGIPEMRISDWGLGLSEKFIYGYEENLTILFFLNEILQNIGK